MASKTFAEQLRDKTMKALYDRTVKRSKAVVKKREEIAALCKAAAEHGLYCIDARLEDGTEIQVIEDLIEQLEKLCGLRCRYDRDNMILTVSWGLAEK